MSVSQFERPPTFDVKIVGGKKIIIWNQNNKNKKTQQKSEDLPSQSQISTSTSNPTSTESTSTATATDEEKNKAKEKDRAALEPVTEGQGVSTNTELKLDDGTENEDRNKKESGDIAVKSKTIINHKESDEKISSGENSPMKRRSASPPSLSSSFKVLPPIKKELEVGFYITFLIVYISHIYYNNNLINNHYQLRKF